jgi:hypothetical protein
VFVCRKSLSTSALLFDRQFINWIVMCRHVFAAPDSIGTCSCYRFCSRSNLMAVDQPVSFMIGRKFFPKGFSVRLAVWQGWKLAVTKVNITIIKAFLLKSFDRKAQWLESLLFVPFTKVKYKTKSPKLNFSRSKNQIYKCFKNNNGHLVPTKSSSKTSRLN